jgi:hypothetical protein
MRKARRAVNWPRLKLGIEVRAALRVGDIRHKNSAGAPGQPRELQLVAHQPEIGFPRDLDREERRGAARAAPATLDLARARTRFEAPETSAAAGLGAGHRAYVR